MDWRKRAYSTYFDYHLTPNRGNQTLAEVKKQFSVWDNHYGRFLPKDKQAQIIDIGCGGGEIVLWLRERGYKNVSGLEADQKQVIHARDLGFDDIRFGDCRDFLRAKMDHYDCIIARDVIEHFDKTEVFELLDILYRALKIGGTIIIQTPNAESPFGSRYRYYDFTHCLSFTPASLYHVLRTVGFSDIVFYPIRPVIHGVKSFFRHILWRLIEIILGFYLLVETGSGRAIFTLNMIAVARKNDPNLE